MTEQIGQQLSQQRQAKEISLSQAAQKTFIRLHFLEAMEAGQFERLPSPVQAKGFLRAYAEFIGLDPSPLIAELESSLAPRSAARDAAREPGVPVFAAPPPVVVFPPTENERLIFTSIGSQLAAQRTLLGLTHADVERHTHLREHYLQALESGNLEGLPSPVQGRGMLNNYAVFLGMDPDPLLLRFAEGLQARHAAGLARKAAEHPRTRQQTPKKDRRFPFQLPFARWLSGDFVIGAILAVSLIAFVVWAAIRVNAQRQTSLATAELPSIASALLTSTADAASAAATAGHPAAALPSATAPAAAVTPASGEDLSTPIVDITPLPAGTGALNLSVVVRQRAWMRVSVDGEIEFEGRVIPGSAYTFSGSDQIAILTGNGAALELTYNSMNLGPLGIFGEVAERVFTVEGLITATPTITPTPSITPTLQATGTGTPAPSPTPSATPSP